jgi:hypothetical protein
MKFQPRFANGAYRDCTFCHGNGCLACAGQANAEYKRQFPDGPKPIATFRLDDPADAAKAEELVGAAALERHFGDDGEGIEGLMKALRGAGKLEA